MEFSLFFGEYRLEGVPLYRIRSLSGRLHSGDWWSASTGRFSLRAPARCFFDIWSELWNSYRDQTLPESLSDWFVLECALISLTLAWWSPDTGADLIISGGARSPAAPSSVLISMPQSYGWLRAGGAWIILFNYLCECGLCAGFCEAGRGLQSSPSKLTGSRFGRIARGVVARLIFQSAAALFAGRYRSAVTNGDIDLKISGVH
jgi:hypothetical protein